MSKTITIWLTDTGVFCESVFFGVIDCWTGPSHDQREAATHWSGRWSFYKYVQKDIKCGSKPSVLVQVKNLTPWSEATGEKLENKLSVDKLRVKCESPLTRGGVRCDLMPCVSSNYSLQSISRSSHDFRSWITGPSSERNAATWRPSCRMSELCKSSFSPVFINHFPMLRGKSKRHKQAPEQSRFSLLRNFSH